MTPRGIRKVEDINAASPYAMGKRRYPSGTRKDPQGRIDQPIRFPPYLFKEILDEAKSRNISFNRMVIILIEAGMAPE